MAIFFRSKWVFDNRKGVAVMAGSYGEIPVALCDCGAIKIADGLGGHFWTRSRDSRLKAQKMGIYFKGERCCECLSSNEMFGGLPRQSQFGLEAA